MSNPLETLCRGSRSWWRGAAGALCLLLACSLAGAWEYDAKTPITDVSITNPTTNEVWLIDTPHTLTCTTSTDTDRRRQTPEDPWEDVDDSVTHYWTGPGTFQNNAYMGTSVTYITKQTAGNETVTVHADDNYTPASNSAIVDEGEKTDSETVEVVGLEVHKVGFGNDHTLYRTPTTNDGWDNSTTAITDPVYNADDSAAEKAAKNHGCFTMGASDATLTAVKCRTPKALTEGSSFELRATGTNTWAWTSFSISAGNSESGAGTLSIYGSLANAVKKYDGSYSCEWKYRCPTGSNTEIGLNTTTHSVYLTYGTPSPGADATVKRIAWVCDVGGGTANTIPPLALGIRDKSHDGTTFAWGKPTPSPIWTALLKDSAHAVDCIRGAMLAVAALKLLGVSSAETFQAYPTGGNPAGDKDASTQETNSCPTHGTVYLRYCTGTPPSSETNPWHLKKGRYLNNFEAGFRVTISGTWNYYTVWDPSGPFTDPNGHLKVLNAITGLHQWWSYDVSGSGWWDRYHDSDTFPNEVALPAP